MAICSICLRGKTSVLNRPHSLRRTKRLVKINLQKFEGLLICSKCRRALSKNGMQFTLPAV